MTDLDKLIRHRLGTRIMTGSEKRAIERVLDIHRSEDGWCVGCGVDVHENEIPHPCDTVQAIAEELRVHDDSVLDVRNG